MRARALFGLCLVAQGLALKLGVARQVRCSRSRSRTVSPCCGLFDDLTNKAGQKVARVSHVMLRTDEAALNIRTKGECYEMLSAWKEVICDDSREGSVLDRFRICAQERSECASRDKGGDLGYVMSGKTSKEFQEVIWGDKEDGDDADSNVYGPFMTDAGLHLLYVHDS